MAVCDAEYCFIIVDIGAMGRRSGGGIFANSNFGLVCETDQIDLPPPSHITEENDYKFPYVFVGDEAFPLKHYLMRSFPKNSCDREKRIYNYRLCRARRTIENTFGIMCAKWRIYQRPIDTDVVVAENVVKATVCLHNWLRRADLRNSDNAFVTPELVDQEDGNGDIVGGTWRQNEPGALRNMPKVGSNNYGRYVNNIRNKFCEYFNTEGAVDWQYNHI